MNLKTRDTYRNSKEHGQVVGLLGPSGVGKTTLSHILAILAEPYTEIVLIEERCAPSGTIIPGARIQSTYNLIERGLAWQDSVDDTPEFMETLREIRTDFQRL